MGLGALARPAASRASRYGRAATGKGTAVLGIDADPPTLNLGTTTDFAAGDVAAKILEGLVWLDPQYNPRPSLATAWAISPDGRTYRFTLRKGVKWHDGKDFTSADVKFSLPRSSASCIHGRPRSSRISASRSTRPTPSPSLSGLQKPYAPF